MIQLKLDYENKIEVNKLKKLRKKFIVIQNVKENSIEYMFILNKTFDSTPKIIPKEFNLVFDFDTGLYKIEGNKKDNFYYIDFSIYNSNIYDLYSIDRLYPFYQIYLSNLIHTEYNSSKDLLFLASNYSNALNKEYLIEDNEYLSYLALKKEELILLKDILGNIEYNENNYNILVRSTNSCTGYRIVNDNGIMEDDVVINNKTLENLATYAKIRVKGSNNGFKKI